MIRLVDDSLGGPQGVTKDKISQVGMFSATARMSNAFSSARIRKDIRPIVFDGYSRHGMYTFKQSQTGNIVGAGFKPALRSAGSP
jgi:hypothetical protein